MKEIILTQGKVTMVDDEDYEYLNQWKWYATEKKSNIWYAQHAFRINGQQRPYYMQWIILGKAPFGFVNDHIDGDGLNNCRHNLRFVTFRQNQQNRNHPKTSIFPGVYWDKKRNKWKAQININGNTKGLGRYSNEYDAFLAYQQKLIEIKEMPIVVLGELNYGKART